MTPLSPLWTWPVVAAPFAFALMLWLCRVRRPTSGWVSPRGQTGAPLGPAETLHQLRAAGFPFHRGPYTPVALARAHELLELRRTMVRSLGPVLSAHTQQSLELTNAMLTLYRLIDREIMEISMPDEPVTTTQRPPHFTYSHREAAGVVTEMVELDGRLVGDPENKDLVLALIRAHIASPDSVHRTAGPLDLYAYGAGRVISQDIGPCTLVVGFDAASSAHEAATLFAAAAERHYITLPPGTFTALLADDPTLTPTA